MCWSWSTLESLLGEKKQERKPERTPERTLREQAVVVLSDIKVKATSYPPHVLVISAFCIGSASALSSARIYRRYFRRIRTAEWVTPDILAEKRWIRGYVTSIGDADNFRLYHMPGLGWTGPLKFRLIPSIRKELMNQTIHIRLAGVDAPEAGHFGKPAQEFSKESLEWLKTQIEGKTVHCQLLRRDKYGRIVSLVYVKPRFLPSIVAGYRNLPIEMLRAGWAETYEQANAEYGHLAKADFLQVQKEAQKARRGIWAHGVDRESAAEYKRRHVMADVTKENDTVAKGVTSRTTSQKGLRKPRFGFWRMPW